MVALPSIVVRGPSRRGKALDRALREVSGYDWVAFTSANAVNEFLAVVDDARKLAGVRLAAVGAATASALADGRLVADLVSETSSAQGLVVAMGSPGGRGRVLFCRAADAMPTLAEGLRAAGWSVDEVEAYRTDMAGADDGATAPGGRKGASGGCGGVRVPDCCARVRFVARLAGASYGGGLHR